MTTKEEIDKIEKENFGLEGNVIERFERIKKMINSKLSDEEYLKKEKYPRPKYEIPDFIKKELNENKTNYKK